MINKDYNPSFYEYRERQFPLAMAYVPIQQFTTTYTPEVALKKGTLFPDLDKPFCGRTIEGGGCRRA